MLIFVTGGARSGKSDFAQAMGEEREGKRLFLATAQAFDEEMEQRIQKHREKRGNRWETIDEPVFLGDALRRHAASYHTILVDCCTLWLSNLLMTFSGDDNKIQNMIDDFLLCADEGNGMIIVVSNEVGSGIVPDNKLAREYRDRLGFLNQAVARKADVVYLLCAGIPVTIKNRNDI